MEILNKKNFLQDSIWKNKDQQYLFELQKFLDLADNIKEEELRKLIISQMLRCDICITNIAEEIFKKILSKNEL